MIAFFQTGGIGDAILGISPMKKLVEMHGKVILLYYDHLVPQVMQGVEGIVSMRMVKETKPSIKTLSDIVPEASMVVSNKFMKDHKGRLNFFLSLDEYMQFESDLMYGVYFRNFMRDFGLEFGKSLSMGAVMDMSRECDYFADWRRYGIDVDYSDVEIPIHQYTIDRNESAVSEIGDFVVVHDSRLGSGVPYVKAWTADRWNDLCGRLSDRGLRIVQFVSDGQETFHESVVPHHSVIGKDAMFQDYLYLLSKSFMYIGTDSWPGHAAIFTTGPRYILIKGAVSRRWDHNEMYATIIRNGSCQSCEGPAFSAHSCMWGMDAACMKSISVDDVMEVVINGV